MMIEEILCALTHVATQLTGRWLPPPSSPVIRRYELTDDDLRQYGESGLAGLDEKTWRSILLAELASFSPNLLWLETLVNAKKIDLGQLVSSTMTHFDMLKNFGGFYLSLLSDDYPSLLKEIARPPLFLSGLGNVMALQKPAVAVIGSRKANVECLQASVEVGRVFADNGWSVVSGGAIGCDIAAHEGVLSSEELNGAAIIVFAGGLCELYPRCNNQIYRSVLSKGGIFLSERLWFQGVRPYDFPSRNRIVSGLSEVTIVMSADIKSGSLITAHEALDQGREVFVFVPDRYDINLAGSHKLVEDGALSFSSIDELMLNFSEKVTGYRGQLPSGLPMTCQTERYLGTFDREFKFN